MYIIELHVYCIKKSALQLKDWNITEVIQHKRVTHINQSWLLGNMSVWPKLKQNREIGC